MLTTRAVDGVEVQALDQGRGPCILIVPGGLSDASAWTRVADRLRVRFRVIRLHRRRYRIDLDLAGCPIADETRDLRALAEEVGEPFVVVGHSSGAVVVLEALAGGLSGAVGAVLYEPPTLLREDEFGEAAGRARADLAAGRPGRAIRGFLRDIVGVSAAVSLLAGVLVPRSPGLRDFVRGQVGDAEALNDLGPRLDAYGRIAVPVLLLTGERSPEHLGRRVRRLADVLPHDRVVVIEGHGHAANDTAPDLLAELITDFTRPLLPHLS